MSDKVHVLSMFDSPYLHHYDLPSSEVVVEIERVEAGELQNQQGKQKKPLVYFRNRKKALGLNKTNAKTLISLYGPYVNEWIGKRVTLYISTTEAFGESGVACIRIRNVAPKADLQVAK